MKQSSGVIDINALILSGFQVLLIVAQPQECILLGGSFCMLRPRENSVKIARKLF